MGSRFRLFIFLSLAFLMTGIVGCLLHECGHAVVAKALGFRDVQIHYASMSNGASPSSEAVLACQKKWMNNIFPDSVKNPCRIPESRYMQDKTAIRLGGPVSNMLIGTLGFLGIFLQRRRFTAAQALRLRQWVLVILSFFWSRQIFNFLTGLLIFIRKGRWGRSDETWLARELRLPHASLEMATAAIAGVLLFAVVFRYIPERQRGPFLLAGIAGTALYVPLWLHLLGPVLMP